MGRHPSPWPRTVTAALTALLVACTGVISGTTASAASTACAGHTTISWAGTAGTGDGHTWTDGGNWVGGVAPGEGDNAVIGVVAAAATGVDGATGTVCDLTLAGGLTADATVSLSGDLTTTGEARVSGFVGYGSGTGDTLTATGGLFATTNANITLNDGATVLAAGTSTAQDGVSIHRPASAAGTAPVVQLAGTLQLTGNATADGVGLQILTTATGGGSLDLNTYSLTLTGPSSSRLESGARIIDSHSGSTPGGSLIVKTDAQIAVATGAQVQSPAALQLQAGSTISTAGTAATLSGTGTLTWKAGTLAGDLTLGLPTVMDGGGTRVIPATSTLTNTSSLQVKDGAVQLDGFLLNNGALRVFPNVLITKLGGTGPGKIENTATNLFTVGADNNTAGSGNVRLVNVAFKNAGTITVVSGMKLWLTGDPGTPSLAEFATTTVLRDTVPVPSTGTPPPKGIMAIGNGVTLNLTGSTTMQGGAVLQLDDADDGTKAQIVAVQGTTPKIIPTAASGSTPASTGTVQWQSGAIRGPLLVEAAMEVNNGTNGSGTIVSKRILDTQDVAAPDTLTLAGATAINATSITLRPKARVLIKGTTTIASAPGGFLRTPELLDGQKVTVALGGTLRRAAQAPSSFSTGPATIGVPVVNYGSVVLEVSLNVPAGYTQDIQPGAAATADKPVTGLYASSVTLSGSDTLGHYAPIDLNNGGLGGTGTVETESLNVGSTWVHPGFQSTAGKLTVKGLLKLSGTSDVQVVMRPKVNNADVHDVLEVLPLMFTTTQVQPGTAYLNGRITGIAASGFSPGYGTRVQNLVTFGSRIGTFTTSSWSGTSGGLGWKPYYDDAEGSTTSTGTPPVTTKTGDGDGKAVDLILVDASAPALGIASNPAFTQFTTQRITYAAVDNKTGVTSYDVRWQRGSPTTLFGAWVYPSGWQGTTATSKTLTGLATGWTYCFSVRARDRAGNITAWSQPLCTAKMFDDRSLTASHGWRRATGKAGFYGGSYTRSTRYAATLTRSGTFTRVAVTAMRCPTCGKVYIYSGSTLLKSLSLKSSSTGITTWVSPVRTRQTTTLKIRVVTSGKPVIIDSFGMVR